MKNVGTKTFGSTAVTKIVEDGFEGARLVITFTSISAEEPLLHSQIRSIVITFNTNVILLHSASQLVVINVSIVPMPLKGGMSNSQ